MKAYWMFWWGRTANPLHQLNGIHWVGVILVVLFFAAYSWILPGLFSRALPSTVLIVPIWGYWVLRVKKMATPFNLLVPQLRLRLLKTSMVHWLIVTLLFAFATTIRERLDHFFAVGLLIGFGLLAFAWLVSLRNLWLAAVVGIGLVCGGWFIAAFLRLDSHGSIGIVILLLGWLMMPVLAWFTINTLLGDGAIRHAKAEQVSRKGRFRDAVHHWFLRRMTRACGNTALRPNVLARVRLEARLNTCFGADFHWSSFFVSGAFSFCVFLALFMMVLGHNETSSPNLVGFSQLGFFMIFGFGNINRFWQSHHEAPSSYSGRITYSFQDGMGKIIDSSNAILMTGLLALAPGSLGGLALKQARARISLRYFLIVWAGCVALYALAFSGLGAGMRDHALVMIATAELAMVGSWVGGRQREWWPQRLPKITRVPDSIVDLINTFVYLLWPTASAKYVWLLLIFTPGWYLQSISLPLWVASCLLGGGAFLWLRWQKLATEPVGFLAEFLAELPAELRKKYG